MEDWEKLKAAWRRGPPPPADRSGIFEPIKANLIDIWNRRPRFSPLWAYRYWWLKSWTMFIGSGIAVWQGAVMLARPKDPVRLDDITAVLPTMHAVRTVHICARHGYGWLLTHVRRQSGRW